MNELTIEDIHLRLLFIAKCFDEICRKNNIPYYMLGGTMLGAIRHKGFIPWDDDMDFGVESKYYDKLLKLLEKELPPYITIKTIENSELIFNTPSKIEDNRTIIKEPSRANIKEDLGINIDIFPLYRTNGNTSFFSRNNMVHILALINSYRFGNIHIMKGWRKISALLLRISFYPFSKLDITHFIHQYLIPNGGSYLSNLYGFWGVKEIIHNEIIGNPTLYKFENIYLYGVENYDKYLCSLYGDYMKVPPIEKRHIHIANVYTK